MVQYSLEQVNKDKMDKGLKPEAESMASNPFNPGTLSESVDRIYGLGKTKDPTWKESLTKQGIPALLGGLGGVAATGDFGGFFKGLTAGSVKSYETFLSEEEKRELFKTDLKKKLFDDVELLDAYQGAKQGGFSTNEEFDQDLAQRYIAAKKKSKYKTMMDLYAGMAQGDPNATEIMNQYLNVYGQKAAMSPALKPNVTMSYDPIYDKTTGEWVYPQSPKTTVTGKTNDISEAIRARGNEMDQGKSEYKGDVLERLMGPVAPMLKGMMNPLSAPAANPITQPAPMGNQQLTPMQIELLKRRTKQQLIPGQ